MWRKKQGLVLGTPDHGKAARERAASQKGLSPEAVKQHRKSMQGYGMASEHMGQGKKAVAAGIF